MAGQTLELYHYHCFLRLDETNARRGLDLVPVSGQMGQKDSSGPDLCPSAVVR